MGIGIQELQFLANASQYGDFGKTITIGRQGLHIQVHQGNHVLGVDNFELSPYCEDMLIKYFGATSVDSIDYSNYEGASLTYDLNEPLPDLGQYDTIIDCGTLEHVFNINQAFKNVSSLCKVGGQILHVLPANNNCGHGFWQFSPELFFGMYSVKNGYRDTKVFIGDTTDPSWFFELDIPNKDERHDIQHPNPVYVMARTVLNNKEFSHKNIQQIDYSYQWSKAND